MVFFSLSLFLFLESKTNDVCSPFTFYEKTTQEQRWKLYVNYVMLYICIFWKNKITKCFWNHFPLFMCWLLCWGQILIWVEFLSWSFSLKKKKINKKWWCGCSWYILSLDNQTKTEIFWEDFTDLWLILNLNQESLFWQ